jgi:hypothetical protein
MTRTNSDTASEESSSIVNCVHAFHGTNFLGRHLQMADSAASKVQIPLPVAFAADNGILFDESVGTTGRLLSFLWLACGAGKQDCCGTSKTADLSEVGIDDDISPGNLVPQGYAPAPVVIS